MSYVNCSHFKFASFTVSFLSVLLGLNGCGAATRVEPPFTLSSPDIHEGQLNSAQTFDGFGCAGVNLSPSLTWSHAPKGTKGFAVTMHDPDAPTDGGFWHWTIFNIPSTAGGLTSGVGQPKPTDVPTAYISGRNDYGSSSYGGACPPAGDKPHRYVFTVYALNVDHLDLSPKSPSALVSYLAKSASIGSASLTAIYARPGPAVTFPAPPELAGFKLGSPDIVNGGVIGVAQQFNQFGCVGKNLPPVLQWYGAPAGVKSFVLTMRDPDAPTDSGFWHWTQFDIPATATEFNLGKLSQEGAPGNSGVNDYGSTGYGGPCPPAGVPAHHYVFTIYAMGVTTLGLDSSASGALVGFVARNNAIASASFTASFGR